MRLTTNHLPAMPIVGQGLLLRWLSRAGATALTLAIAGLESWLRLPVHLLLDQTRAVYSVRNFCPSGRATD